MLKPLVVGDLPSSAVLAQKTREWRERPSPRYQQLGGIRPNQ